MSVGRLHIIIGPMFSGKTTELIRYGNRYKSIGKNVLLINHSSNIRYNESGEDIIVSHDRSMMDACINRTELSSVTDLTNYGAADVILIEEGQFFEDIYDFVRRAIDVDHKIVVIAGLDGDYKREEIGDVLRLIPLADSVNKLTALCKRCGDGTVAPFTKLIKNLGQMDNTNVCVGGSETYEPLCRKHFNEP